jgi:integrase
VRRWRPFSSSPCSVPSFPTLNAQGIRPKNSNPAHEVEPFKEHSRERFLSATEVGRLGEALTKAEKRGILPAPSLRLGTKRADKAKHRPKSADKPIPANPLAVAAIRFLLLTGWREGEALGPKWSDLDLEHGRATLTDTKTGKSQRAIGAPARLLLSNLPRLKDAVYVFPGASAKAPLKDISRLWYAVRHAAQLEET